MATEPAAPAGAGELAPGCALIEVHVGELKQLFNSLDPTPFRERDLDPKAEEFIAGWAREIPAEQPLGLRIHIDRDSVPTEELAVVRDAVRDYFSHRAKARRLEVRLLFQRGRVSLAIGLAFLAAAIVGGDVAATLLRDTRFESLARESLMIGGWSRCGARLKCSCTTGGQFKAKHASSIA